MKNITLVYQHLNAPLANQISQELEPAGLTFRHLSDDPAIEEQDIHKQLVGNQGPVIFLISDNFLRSRLCMHRALSYVPENYKPGRGLLVVTDGLAREDEEWKVVPTKFERLSHIIQYMNHWQEEYLELRKRKRDVYEDEESSIKEKLAQVRSISADIGEFFQFIRSANTFSLDEFGQQHYRLLFEWLKDEQAYNNFVNVHQSQQILRVKAPEVNTKETIQASVGEHLTEEKISQEVIEAIPGLSMLEEKKAADNIRQLPLKPKEVEEQTEKEYPTEKDNHELLQSLYDDEQNENEVAENIETNTVNENQNETYLDDLSESENQDEPNMEETEIEQLSIADQYDYILNLMEEDKNKEALSLLHGLLQRAPNHLSALLDAAALAEHFQDYHLARSYYERIEKIDNSVPDLYFKLGLLNNIDASDDPKKAAKYLKKAFKRNPYNPTIAYYYALIYNEKLDNTSKAIKYFYKTLELDPKHEFANYDLALIYHQQDDLTKAAEHYYAAYQNNPELKTPENDQAFAIQPIEEEPLITEEPELEEIVDIEVAATEVEAPVTLQIVDDTLEAVTATEEEIQPTKETEAPTVLITGATSGIGKATAYLFAEKGYRLILTGRREDRLQSIQAELAEQSPSVETLAFDVRDRNAVKEAVDQLIQQNVDIDLLINNAGLASGFDPIHEADIDDWETMIDTNVKGLLYMTRAIAPLMVSRKSGHIINVCSTAGHETYPNGNVYCATKHAVKALTKAMRLDLYKHRIRVSQVSPGHVEETEFALVRFHGDEDRAKIYEDFTPLNSKDVAETIYFIATRPKHINIQDIVMMGTQQAGSNFIDRNGRIE